MTIVVDTSSVIFVAVLAVVVLAVLMGVWGIWRNNRQLDTSMSFGRQLFGRRKKS